MALHLAGNGITWGNLRWTTLLLMIMLLLTGCASAGSNGAATEEAGATGQEGSLIGTLTPVAADDLNLTVGQVLYVPVYSEIFDADESRTYDLTVMLSIRNTDFEAPIILESVQYFDSSGNLIRNYVEAPLALSPMATSEIVITRLDKSGGTGPNFIVVWGAETPVHEPIVEALMTSTSQQQGLSFLSVARVLESRP